MLFDCRRHRSADSHSVATHDHKLFLAVLIQIGRIERLRIFCMQFEHLPHFDAAGSFYWRAAARTGVPLAYQPDVSDMGRFDVTTRQYVDKMPVSLVCAADGVMQSHYAGIRNDRNIGQCNRSDVAWLAVEQGLYLFFTGHFQLQYVQQVGQFDFIHFMIAADQSQHRPLFRDKRQRFDQPVRRQRQISGNIINRLFTRRGNCFKRFFRFSNRCQR